MTFELAWMRSLEQASTVYVLANASTGGWSDAARDFLERSGARRVTIPHRANRAVIFDSDLFHETDTITFREGYENRRINCTLLYGFRDI